MMTITYEASGRDGLYINLTNRCPCNCTFCLRSHAEGVYGSDSLWLDHDPSFAEICDSLGQRDLKQYQEIVFCGYGEPTERLDVLLEVASYIKHILPVKIRINTNGLADLIYGERTAPKLEGLIDVVSISLNATDPEEYQKIVRPSFGAKSFDAMLAFAKDCVQYVPEVVMTVVDVVTSPEEQEKSRQICESIGATLRIRPYEE